MLEVLNNIMTRRSVRNYKNEPLSQAMIDALLKAGNSAPSGKFKMPRHFLVVTDRAKLDAVSENHPHAAFLKEAPLAIIVCGEVEKSPNYWEADCAAATENILLAANALHLGSCWCCVNTHEEIINYLKQEFEIPNGVEPYSMAVVGKPIKANTKIRELKESVVHTNKW